MQSCFLQDFMRFLEVLKSNRILLITLGSCNSVRTYLDAFRFYQRQALSNTFLHNQCLELHFMTLGQPACVNKIIIQYWNIFPLFILGGVKFEFLGSSDALTTDLHKPQPFVKGTTGPLSAVYLVLHNQPMPIMHLFRCQLTDQHSDRRGYSWPMLLGRLAKGELIYPWVKSRYFRNQLKKQFSAARCWFHQ